MAEIFDRVKKVVVDKLKVNESQIEESSSFVEDLGADSLDVVDLVIGFEDEFDIQIPDEDSASIKTVGDAVNYISGKMSN
ncbi:MAG: acyl carrier protein [Abditibacteriota bacterium]|nr:acyl carrier protein [Abditibacteriota bacterium]